jgi:hypothetical protein
MAPASTVEERLARLEATEQMRTLAHEYCHGLDKRQLERFLAIWAPSAEWVLAEDNRPTGPDEIAEVATGGIWPAFTETHHWTSNHVVDWSGELPTGTCDVSATVRDVSGRWLRASATYVDTYVEHGGRWLIARREATTHFTEPLG